MAVIIDGSASATFATPLPVTEGGTGSSVAAAFGRVVRTAGNITTTSTSLVDVTGATVTITTGAFPVAYGVAKSFQHGSLAGNIYFNIDIDGVKQIGSLGIYTNASTAGYTQNGSFTGISVALTAAAHTIKEMWSVNTGTGTIIANSVNSHLFYAQEIR